MARAVKSQRPLINAPPRTDPGIRTRQSDVANIDLHICGTASPMKEIGPANAVTAAVIMLEMRMVAYRVRLTFIPMLAAYLSPRERALRDFAKQAEINSIGAIIEDIIFKCCLVNPANEPIVHIAKFATASLSANDDRMLVTALHK